MTVIKTKWYIDGQKYMLIKNIVTSASFKFKSRSEEVKGLLEDELNKVNIDDTEEIMRCLFHSSSLNEFMMNSNEINSRKTLRKNVKYGQIQLARGLIM